MEEEKKKPLRPTITIIYVYTFSTVLGPRGAKDNNVESEKKKKSSNNIKRGEFVQSKTRSGARVIRQNENFFLFFSRRWHRIFGRRQILENSDRARSSCAPHTHPHTSYASSLRYTPPPPPPPLWSRKRHLLCRCCCNSAAALLAPGPEVPACTRKPRPCNHNRVTSVGADIFPREPVETLGPISPSRVQCVARQKRKEKKKSER